MSLLKLLLVLRIGENGEGMSAHTLPQVIRYFIARRVY
jgi:hypothetical protein